MLDLHKKNALASINKEWRSLVGDQLGSNCTPLHLRNEILIIGASHPQWRQALIYTRNQLLESLRKAGYKIKDIKVQQYHPRKLTMPEAQKSIWDNHPSRIDIHGYEECKSCSKPASLGEINRWGKCSFCIRKDISNEKKSIS
tara:strand:+ start:543 stop:971 length:429 start_codon:yes stop_codon:yes gene_type:complete